MQDTRPSTRRQAPAISLCALALTLGLAHGGAWAIGGLISGAVNKGNEAANKVGGAVSSGVSGAIETLSSPFAKTSQAAVATYNSATKTVVDKVGTVVLDSKQTIGKKLGPVTEGTPYEVLKDGKLVGQVIVNKDNKIGWTRTLDSTGKVLETTVVSGPKYVVANDKIVGREIIVGGKVVGEEIIDATGKVTGNKVLDSGKFVLNKANEFVVNGMAPAVCKALMTSITAQSKIDVTQVPAVPGMPGLPKFEDQLAALKTKTDAMKKTLVDGTAKATPHLEKLAARYLPAEFERLSKFAKDNTSKAKELFTEQLVCNGSTTDILAKIKALGLDAKPVAKTAWLDLLPLGSTAYAQAPTSFFTTYTWTVSGAAAVGLVTQVTMVTDGASQVGVYFGIGPTSVSNATAGAGFTMGFFPSVTMDSFEGWGWALSAAGGPAKKILSVSVEFNFNDALEVMQGFGVGVGAGLGFVPVDGSVTGTYTFRIK